MIFHYRYIHIIDIVINQQGCLQSLLHHMGLHPDGSADPSLGHGEFGIEHQGMHPPAAQLFNDRMYMDFNEI